MVNPLRSIQRFDRTPFGFGLKKLLRLATGLSISISGLAVAQPSLIDQLVVLENDGRSYTTQLTIAAGTKGVDIRLPGSVVPLSMVNLDPNGAGLPEQLTGQSFQINNSVLLLRYEHQYDTEVSSHADLFFDPGAKPLAAFELNGSGYRADLNTVFDQTVFDDKTGTNQFLKLTTQASTVVANTDDIEQLNLTWIFPEEFSVLAWKSSDHEAVWARQKNRLQYTAPTGIPSELEIYLMRSGENMLDDDEDGIVNDADSCPGTPSDILIDSKGCALDSDADGISDSVDHCPNTATGAPTDADGCEPDADSDGTTDKLDECPNTPLRASVEQNGCPIDSDGDKVPDYRDLCVSLMELPASEEIKAKKTVTVKTSNSTAIPNVYGCGPIQADAVDAPYILSDISFNTGSSHLSRPARDTLEKVASVIIHHSTTNFEIGAHTDSRGTKKNNQSLSFRRANSVRHFLLLSGIKPNRIIAKGYGEVKPIDSNTTREGRQANRRIEISTLRQAQ